MGFIGSNFIRYMLSNKKDIEMINLDNFSSGSNSANLRDVESDDRYTFIKGSITDFPLVSKIVENVDAIVNFAAETHVDRSIANPKPFFESNAYGTFNLLEVCRSEDVKFVHVSTDEIYGDIAEGSFNEEDRLCPSNPYSASKAAADAFVLAYHRTYGLDAVVTRCTNNFGPYQFPEKLIPKTIIRANMGLKVSIYGSGKNVRDWIYVLDHCEALDIVLRKGKPGETYNISSGNEFKNIEVVERILQIMDKPKELITFVEDRPGHDVRYSLDSSKMRRELSWKPKHDFETALKQTTRWYLENEWWWKPIASEEVLHLTPWKLRW
jgi:dTDP-glucose 4,6-dehydratase